MSAAATAETSSRSVSLRARQTVRAWDHHTVALWVIVAVQAIWLGALMWRGWYYQDDLAFMAQANGRTLGLAYLTDPVNDHLTPGLRLVFWLLQPLGASGYGVTVIARLALQAGATLLLHRLMVRLVGRSWLGLAVLACYAVSPLLLGMTWLTVAAMVLPAQVLVLTGLLLQVEYIRNGRLRHAAWAGVAFGAAAMFLELSGIDAVLVVPLALGFGYEGTVRQRFAAMRKQWLGWLLAALPLSAFAVAYLAGGYGGSARSVSGGTLLRFAWRQWSETVAPMALGGPWRWFSSGVVYVSWTQPPGIAVWLTQAVVLGAIVLSLRRSGVQALAAWCLPVVFVALCSAIVSVGRFDAYGYLAAHTITYAFGAAVPCSLAVVLAFRPSATAVIRRHRVSRIPARRAPVLLVAGVIAGATLSGLSFTDRWAKNPTERYVDTLRSSLASHPNAALFDTPLPTNVLPYIQPVRYLSDVLPLLNAHAWFNGPGAEIVDGQGRIVPATFLPAAQLPASDPTHFCDYLVSGRVARVWQLTGPAAANEWFLRLDYFQQHASVVHVALVDAGGARVFPVTGSRVVLGDTLATTYVRFPQSTPVAVRVWSESPATNVCLTAVQVGSPFPTSGD